MNNKGFAITSVIYGLAILGMMIILILMGTVSASRRNVVEQAEHVEEFLIFLNQATGIYSSTGDFIVPKGESGWYRVEAFGRNKNGYHGSYTTGIIYLKESDTYQIIINDNYSGLKVGSRDIMKAGAAKTDRPGGGIKCYSAPATGGNIGEHQSITGTLTGIDGVTFSTSGCNLSFIAGHPGSDTTGPHDYYFVDGLMLPGASGVDGGRVIINRLAGNDGSFGDIPIKNTAFENVSKITVSSSGKVYYSYHEANGDGFLSQIKECGSGCSFSAMNIDGITFIANNEKESSRNVSVSLKHADGSTTVVYTGNTYGYGTTMGDTGVHISAYQPPTKAANFATHGNYYLIPVVKETNVVTASSTVTDPLSTNYITGETKQKWAIDYIDENFPNITNPSGKREYRIMELSQYKAMSIALDENYEMNTISAAETFNSLSRNNPQIWNVRPMEDGTIAIKTVVPSLYQSSRSGFLFASTSDNKIYIGSVQGGTSDDNTYPKSVERFYAYSLDFGK